LTGKLSELTEAVQAMIFRPSALRRYNERVERAVLPRLAAPRIRLPLCILFGLLAITLIGASITEVPIYAGGVAVKTAGGSGSAMPRRLMALVPAENLPSLKVGQKAFLRPRGKAGVIRGSVSEIRSDLLNPDEVKTRFDLSADSSAQLRNGAAMAVIDLDESERSQLSLDEAVRFSDTRIEVGSRRLLAALLQGLPVSL
jgi:hypothetical protein